MTPTEKRLAPIFWMIICLGIGLGIISNPSVAYKAAKNGLKIWWEIVLPSLFPFFVISELLVNLGFVAFLGVILEPLMRPLFNLPGACGFVVGMSFLSGFPLSAVLTAQLRSTGLCTREEGERLVSFTSNASPLFILGAVSVGMFQNPRLGPYLLAVHYLSNLICGLLIGSFSKTKKWPRQQGKHGTCLLLQAVRALCQNSQLPKKGMGTLLSEAISRSFSNLLTIGGFITFFSVFLSILKTAGLFSLISDVLAPITVLLKVDPSLVEGMLNGFFEITVGIRKVSESSGTLLQQLMATEAILAWNGLAIQAQVAGMITGTDLGILPYLVARLLQVPITVSLTYLVFAQPWQKVSHLEHPGGGLLLVAVICSGIGFCWLLSRFFWKILPATFRKIIIIR